MESYATSGKMVTKFSRKRKNLILQLKQYRVSFH